MWVFVDVARADLIVTKIDELFHGTRNNRLLRVEYMLSVFVSTLRNRNELGYLCEIGLSTPDATRPSIYIPLLGGK